MWNHCNFACEYCGFETDISGKVYETDGFRETRKEALEKV
jgi:2-iminoacetate synthase ThiH